jgi:hypothetical protein
VPQNTEGGEVFTAAITPTNSSNLLIFHIFTTINNSAGSQPAQAVALFQDTTANALAIAACEMTGANDMHTLSLFYSMSAGTTSSTTFKVRIGASISGTSELNGRGGSQYAGAYSSGMSIMEIKV